MNDQPADDYLSKRAHACYMIDNSFWKCFFACETDAFHPKDNKEGYVNFGSAINYLMDAELTERLQKEDVLKFYAPMHQYYFNFSGIPRLKEAVTNFFNRHYKPEQPLQQKDFTVLTGTTACIDAVAFTLFDPGDCFLIPTPYFSVWEGNMRDKGRVTAVHLNLDAEPDESGESFSITPEILERRIKELLDNGAPLRGFVLIHPNNPTGDTYSEARLRGLLGVCAKYKIHAIIDEIYSFSTFDPEAKFVSVLALSDLPDPGRTHCIWSFTKDIGLPGFRCGFIHSRNPCVTEALSRISQYQCVPSLIQDTCATLLNDTEWLDDFFMPLMQRRLYDSYTFTVERLTEMGVPIKPARGGFFVWADFRPFIHGNTHEAERAFFDELLRAHLCIVPGKMYYCSTPGWFRIVFSVPMDILSGGLEMLAAMLKNRKKVEPPCDNNSS